MGGNGEMNAAQIELCILLCLVYVTWGLTDSIQAPFYPIEATAKGATASQYGLVFGIIHLAMFIASPIFGHFLPRLGLRRVFSFGVLATAGCACCFGLLGLVQSTWGFLGFSYALRIVEGVAEAGAWASVLTLLAEVYGDKTTWVYSLTQASFGFAEILGPSVGGIMYDAGGFLLPFEVSGLLCLIIGVFTLFRLPTLMAAASTSPALISSTSSSKNLLPGASPSLPLLQSYPSTRARSFLSLPPSMHLSPSLAGASDAPDGFVQPVNIPPTPSSSTSLLPLLSSPSVLLPLIGTVFGAVCQGFIETFLEEYLALFGLNVTQIGVSFLAMSVPYMLAFPAFGSLVSAIPPVLVSIAGYILVFAAFLLVGPPSYLPIAPSLLLTEVGLGVLGIGTAATLAATFALAQQEAAKIVGDADHSVISGLWTAAFALGNFIGPTVGGPLVTALGFTNTTPLLQVWAVLGLTADLVVLTLSCKSRSQEYTRLM